MRESVEEIPSIWLFNDLQIACANLRWIVNNLSLGKNNCDSTRNHCKLTQLIRAHCGCAAIPKKKLPYMQINWPISVFGRGISNISESIMGKSCTKNLKVAKMKLFQLTPIRHAKSPGHADASFVLQIQVARGRQLPPPRLFLSGAFSLEFSFDLYLVNFLRSSWFRTKSINNRSTVSLCLSLSLAKNWPAPRVAAGYYRLLKKSKANALGKVLRVCVFVVICNKCLLGQRQQQQRGKQVEHNFVARKFKKSLKWYLYL